MRLLASSLAIGLMAAIGCDGETNNGSSTAGAAGDLWEQFAAGGHGPAPTFVAGGQWSSTGATPSGGMNGSGQTGNSTSSNPPTAGCNLPACYTNLASACSPEGTCVAQDAGMSSTVCFSNGVKAGSVINTSTGVVTITYKKGAATCFSVTGTLTSNSATITDGSGNTVATLESRDSGDRIMTCTGQAPVTLNSACDVGDTSENEVTCTTGTCTM